MYRTVQYIYIHICRSSKLFFDTFNSGLILLIVSRYNREVSSLEETCKWRVLMRNCKSNCILERPTIGRARVSESERQDA